MRAVQKSSYEIAKILLAHPEIDVNQVGTFRINQFNILLHSNIIILIIFLENILCNFIFNILMKFQLTFY